MTATDEAAPAGRLRLYMELSKARLSAMVMVTTGTGFVLGSTGAFNWLTALWTMIGASLAALSANALNQCWERDRDQLMERTRHRPLPSGRLKTREAVIVSLAALVIGITLLAVAVNMLAAGLTLLTAVTYMLIYTPMKVRSSLNTLVGAVCGAIPPMIGWAAATGSLEPGAWLLAAILFVWQIPHFLALAWLYRDDYQRGGFVMLPCIDQNGQITCQVIVVSCLLLVPLGLLGVLMGVTGWIAAAGAVALGAIMLGGGCLMYRHRTRTNARALFLTSLLYLPVLLGLMVLDRSPVHTFTGSFVARAAMTSMTDATDLPVIGSPAATPNRQDPFQR